MKPISFKQALETLLSIILLLAIALPGKGQKSPQPSPQPDSGSLQVATRVIPPFVIEKQGKLEGFSIELWQSIAQELDLKTTFQVQPSVAELLTTIKEKKANLGIAAISITSERQRNFDFSQPIFTSGLQILVRADSNAKGLPLAMIFTPELFQLLGISFVLILIPAHLIWWVERKQEDSLFKRSGYFPGIFTALWWSAGTLGAQVDEMPKTPLGRVLAIAMMFASVFFIAYFTATVTTSLTVQQLQGSIRGPNDLPGKRVATTTGSTAAAYLQQASIRPVDYRRIDEAYTALLNNQVDAVVFDAPVLLYYANNEGKGKVQVVGPLFRNENYGIILPQNSPYRTPINAALLTLRENGTYEELYNKWFGSEQSP